MDQDTLRMLVEGGFATLCALYVWQSFKREDRMSQRLDQVEDRSVRVIENNTKAITELTVTLNDRPCLRREEK